MDRMTIDRDSRNVLTWRIPNDPSPKTKQSSNSKNKKINNQNNKINVNQSNTDNNNNKNNNNKDNNNNNNNSNDEDIEVQSPISSPKIKKDNDNDNDNDNNARIHNRLWKSFFASVTRSVDELYYLCEEEGDEQKVQDAVELFERSVHDFVKLIERIREQRRFSMDQTTAISWEVRKPTVSRSTKCFSPGSPNFQLMSAIKASPQSNNKALNEKNKINIKQETINESSSKNNIKQNLDIQRNEKVNANSKLRAAAPVFLPSNKNNNNNDERLEITNTSTTSFTNELKNKIESGNHSTEVVKNKITNVNADIKIDNIDKENNNTNITKSMKTTDIQNNSNFSSIDDWDAETEAEVVLASEKIWAEAEAWIEAEAAVEEAAWEVLGFDDHKINNNSNDDNEIQSKFKSNITENVLFNKKSVVGIKDFSEKDAFKDGKENSDANSSINSNYNSDDENDNSIIVIDNNTESKVDRQNNPQYRCKTPLSLSANNNSNFSTPDNFCDDNSSKSPSQQNMNLTPTSRSLHDKLSSPCRRRSLTPVEAKMKAEARQLAAEAHRGGIVQERIEKAKLTWTRIKMRGEKEAQRLAQLEHALEEKLKEAEKRHEEYIKFIKGKAGNENAKVSEVMFINSLNSDMVAEHLQQKFEEVEARVLAAAQRRQERLDAISNQKMRKNSRKTVQMSELRLRLEHIKMERWNNLQKRLETVNQRRLSRLAEMKRRSDEESSKPTIMSPAITEKVISQFADNIQVNNDEKDTIINKMITTIFEDSEGKFVDEVEKRPIQEASIELQSESVQSKSKAVTHTTKNVNSTNERVLLWNFWKVWSSQIKKKGTSNSRNAAILKKWSDVCETLRSRQEVKSKSTLSGLITEMLNDSIIWLDSISKIISNVNSNKKKVIKNSNYIVQNIEKFSNILTTIYKSKNIKDSIHDFINSNGLLLLRVFLGTEMGLLESEENFSSGVKSNFWTHLGRLLNDICGRASERDKILESGTAVLISDYIHCTLLHLLSWRESKFQPIDTDEYFGNDSRSGISINSDKKKKKNNNKKSLNNIVAVEVFNMDDSSNANNSKGKSVNNSNTNNDFNKSWPQEFLILPHLLNTAMLLFRHIPSDDDIIGDCQNKLIWYFFASGTLNLICNCLVDLQQLTNEVTEFDLPYTYANSLLGLLSALASFLRLSAGVSPYTMITSITCLSSKQHKHPRGREMVSLLRAADMIPSMISLLGSFILSKRNTSNTELTSPVYSLTLTILQSLIELATVDLSLLQELPQDSQVSIIHCASHLIQSLLLTQARSDSDEYSYLLATANVVSLEGFIRNSRPINETNDDRLNTIKFSVVDADLCLDRLFSFLGLICLRSPCMQTVISRGTTPTLLIELCRLPIRFFTEERLKRQLLPCLISICLDSPDNLNVLKIELSCSILASFLKDSQQQLLDFEEKKHDDKNVKSISTYLCQLSHRLPLDLWDIAIKTFEEIKIQKKDQQNNNNNFQKSLLSVD